MKHLTTRIARSIALALAVFCAATTVFASDRNGNWWGSQSKVDKLQYVAGFFDGIMFQNNRIRLELTNMLAPMSYKQPCDQACVKLRVDQSFDNWNSIQRATEDLDKVTAGQLVDGCDKVYADYRNRSIQLFDILEIVMWNIRGVPGDLIEGRLAVLRAQN
jgi:hypothetical protein